MDKLICLTCQVSLPSHVSQREHYKSEWHLYNLKRKLNQLKSITEDEFSQIKNKHSEQADQSQTQLESSHLYCNVCSKNFLNPKVFEQHNSSNKHNRQLAIANKLIDKIQDKNYGRKISSTSCDKREEIFVENQEFNESDWEEIDSDEEILESIPVDECLFCGHLSENIESNLSHMSKEHSFFIPDVEYCVDVKGLLNYLGTKIASGLCCLWCSDYGKSFASKKSAQQHMIDVGHTKINFHNRSETLLEFEDFYDYSSSYPEGDNFDEEIDLPVLNNNDYQLKLPSGAVIGHRTLLIYYKQKLKPRVFTTQDRSKNKELLNKISSHYKSLGWTGLKGSASVQYARDVHYMNHLSQKLSLKIGQKNNLTKQTNFRSQVGFK